MWSLSLSLSFLFLSVYTHHEPDSQSSHFMEGNFYISDKVVDNVITSRWSQAYQTCREPAQLYGRCVEGGQINRALKKNLCEAQREALRQCVRLALQASSPAA